MFISGGFQHAFNKGQSKYLYLYYRRRSGNGSTTWTRRNGRNASNKQLINSCFKTPHRGTKTMENKNSCFQNKVKYVQQPGRGSAQMRCIEPTGHLPLNNQNMKHVLTQSWKLLFCEELEDHCNAHLHRIGNHFNMICWWTFSCPNLPISWHSKHRANILYRLQFCNHPNYILPLSSFPTTRVLLSSSSFDMAILF